MGKTKRFDELLLELESIVSKLENGNIPLEDSISSFEAGVKLYKECKSRLGSAEKKVKLLSEGLKEEEFDN